MAVTEVCHYCAVNAGTQPLAPACWLMSAEGLRAILECMQASVGMGELGISLGDPDDWALDVLGDILNSFGGRLFDRIRSREVCKHFWEG